MNRTCALEAGAFGTLPMTHFHPTPSRTPLYLLLQMSTQLTLSNSQPGLLIIEDKITLCVYNIVYILLEIMKLNKLAPQLSDRKASQWKSLVIHLFEQNHQVVNIKSMKRDPVTKCNYTLVVCIQL